jgi:ABC-2 type transport system permease protein
MRGFLSRTEAFIRRDFYIQTSYKFQLIFDLTAGFFVVLLFYFISALIDPEKSRDLMSRFDTDYFSFVLIGVAAAGFLQTGLAGFARTLRTEMSEGSLEMMLSCPTRPVWIMVLPCLWSFFFEAVKALLVVLFGVFVLGADLGKANLLGCALVLVLTITSYSVFGMLSAAIIMVVKRGDPINLAFSAASSLVAGAYFPLELLPSWLGTIAKILPMTYAYRGLRQTLLGGAGPLEVAPEALLLGGFSVVGLPVALAVARIAVDKAKRDGTVGIF